MANRRILVVRLGSMGDVIHTLPAASTLKHSFPGCHLGWIIDPKWSVLLEGNPYVDEIIPFNRRKFGNILEARRRLRNAGFDTVIDFQGLIKSALVASAARPERIYGFHESQVRERLSALFYSHRTRVEAAHVVDRNLELAESSGAANAVRTFPLPKGEPEGKLPTGRSCSPPRSAAGPPSSGRSRTTRFSPVCSSGGLGCRWFSTGHRSRPVFSKALAGSSPTIPELAA